MKSTNATLILVLTICALACQRNNDSKDKITTENSFELPDSLSSKRISFILDLKEVVADKYWEDFGENKVEGTFIYFNNDTSEVFFPSSQVLQRLDDYDEFSSDYVVSTRTDSVPYHFELMISFDDSDSTKLFFDHPVQQFLSVEETNDYIPSVRSTEMWSTMVIHEMFHHFQYNNASFKVYAKDVIGVLPYDIRDLIRLCQEDEHFLDLIQKENGLILKAIEEENSTTQALAISEYIRNRKKRIDTYSKSHVHLEKVEDYYTIQEGSARYLEFQCMNIFRDFKNATHSPEIHGDPRFEQFEEFEIIDLKSEDFNYLTYAGATDYHYAIGFNIMRLLDKLGVDYKENIINTPETGLHKYLEKYMNTLPSQVNKK